ncbi:aldo/keto reductase [Temperatibacter marinus]|uniref:Aldo/keto reductase n=1 Tax=Temperatibacter marinus TaxID=1456591 RepID=A0AA52EFP1_9PROT|nr:aldo/keto reductase [Temperatibacter marinus]WND02833.1 aldo/keto reductase [Temperatibacter marinus]
MSQVYLPGIELGAGPLAFGFWRFAGSTVKIAQEKIETALDVGITLMDNADVYGYDGTQGFGDAETLQGDVLRGSPALRDQMIVATKGGVYLPGPYRSEKGYLIEACERSLTRLGVDVIDLYQIHRPDLQTPWQDVAEALNTLYEQGKIKAAGVSNYSADQMRALKSWLKIPLVSVQPEVSPANMDAFFNGVTDFAQEIDAAVLAWSPLGGGALTSADAAEESGEKAVRVFKILQSIAERENVEAWHVALKFLMMHGSKMIPILGTQSPKRIRESVRSVSVHINRVEWYEIVEAWSGEAMP